jgi:hypothetical protein
MSSWGNISSVKKKTTIPYDAVVCCIALDEEPYIDEWIQYHLLLGFSHIYIYDNSKTNTLRNRANGKVTVHHIPGVAQQLTAYNLFVQAYKRKHRWGAFIDCDEFIILKKHSTIIDFLREYNDCSAVALQWKMFGTNHETMYRNEPVTKRFQLCSKTMHPLFKSICQLLYVVNYISPHKPQLTPGHLYDTAHRMIPESDFEMQTSCEDIAYIHHYYTKSEEEFRNKINRGRADMIEKRSLEELVDIHLQHNDVVNTDAWDFYTTKTVPS